MWQIAWMWSLIPTSVLYWIINLIILAGVVGLIAGWLGRWIPWFGIYARLLKPIGIILLVLGVWMRGGYDTEMAWRAKVEALEAKVKESEQRSQQANRDLEKALKDKKNRTKEVQVVIQERIKEVEKRIDAECKVDREALEILNDAAKNQGGKKK